MKSYIEEHPEDECLVYLMSANAIDNWAGRTRKLDRNQEIQEYFQGEQPTKDGVFRKGEVYPGDRNIKDENLLTIQIHLFNIRNTTFNQVPGLAIWIPEHIGTDIIRQV